MYSLYRAWLMRDAVAAPDVLVSVGGHQFPAHRHVLTAHSGYLKALLAASLGPTLSVPNVGPEAFGPLLAYMYSGYLDLHADNIYAVLLATHLLHIPRALDLCRNYLLLSQPQAPPRPTVLKPIPSRKLLPPLCQPPPPWPHPPALVLPNGNSSFQAFSPPGQAPRSTSPLAIPSTSSSKSNVLMTVRSPIRSSSISPCLSDSSYDSDEVNVNVSSDENEKTKKSSRKLPCTNSGVGYKGKVIIDVACCDGPVRFHRVLNDNYGLALEETGAEENVGITSMRKELASKRKAEMNSSVVRKKVAKMSARLHGEKKDHLQRVNHVQETVSINNQKGEKVLKINESGPKELTELKTPVETQVVTSHKQVQPVEPNVIKQVAVDLKSVSASPVSNVDSDKCTSTGENAKQIRITELDANNPGDGPEKRDAVNERAETVYFPDQPGTSTDPAQDCSDQSGGPDSIYTCVYCKHTFKSKYCYQKHARRHINPAGAGAKGAGAGEVKLLDMNVQYYPCKTCGSKFPSYYFVHKHRKLCHADEGEEPTASDDSTITSV